MRRKSSLILLVAAVFCVALAPLLREFVLPRLVADSLAGEDAYRVLVMDAHNATLAGAPEGPGKADVTEIRTIRPNAKAGNDGAVVWDVESALLDSTGKMVGRTPERYVFDAATQNPKHCCGEMIDGAPAAHTGVAYRWPIFTGKRDYNYYDSRAHAANVISYRGTAERSGLTTYVFEQQVAWTKIPMPRLLPGGLDPAAIEKDGAQLWYTATRKVWVEPVTGTPVYLEESRKEELRTPPPPNDPQARPTVTPVFEGTFTPRPAWAADLAADAKDEASRLRLLHDTLPIALLVVGVVLFLVALGLQFLADRPARTPRQRAAEPARVAGSDDRTEVLPPVPAGGDFVPERAHGVNGKDADSARTDSAPSPPAS